MRKNPDKHSTSFLLLQRGLSLMLENLRDSRLSEEIGQTMAEYAVVLGVITLAIVVTLGLLSSAVQNLLTNVISTL
jgi:Flp pilus assembly pilin Flp